MESRSRDDGRIFPKGIIHEYFQDSKSLNFPVLPWMKIDSPRHIIMQFHYTGDKEKILNVSREKKENMLYTKDQGSE